MNRKKLVLWMLACAAFWIFVVSQITGCVTLTEILDEIPGLDDPVSVVTNIPPMVSDDAVTAQTLWPCVFCNWMIHGEEGEDKVRLDAISAARAKGLDAIGFKLRKIDNKHLIIALWEWEHDEQAGKFRLDNFTRRARDKGIKRWVVDIGGVDINWVNDIFRAYGPDSDFRVQYCGVKLTAAVRRALECDANGEKISKRRMRKDPQVAKTDVKSEAVSVDWATAVIE